MSKRNPNDILRNLFDPTSVDPHIKMLRDSIEQTERLSALAKTRIKDEKQLMKFLVSSDKAIKSYMKQLAQMERLKEEISQRRESLLNLFEQPVASPDKKTNGKKGVKK